ncbi:putative calcium-binding protein CML45 [Prunus yedoensis var. nudiflora]|uniref:Putative calcium-binding protein CML45 n=1 Tax=Prunus yedoensis var. nudiflora TaxID=2094558 RepID=A0A314YVN7_PRUYE|nr:putative calcium-binding protein CML45 [Prunus yedoensis var. nudiflora]
MEKTMSEAFGFHAISVVLLLFIILNLLLILHLPSSSWYALVPFFICFLSDLLQIIVWSESSKCKTIQKRSCIAKKQEVTCLHENENVVDDKKQLCTGELGQIMEKLGTLFDADGGEVVEGRVGSKEIADLFEEEPSLEEVKEAFHVFDENKDGFIDAGEIYKVLCALGFVGASEVECKRMIRAFDRNGDGQIDFNEFVQLMENSFC